MAENSFHLFYFVTTKEREGIFTNWQDFKFTASELSENRRKLQLSKLHRIPGQKFCAIVNFVKETIAKTTFLDCT